MEFIVMILLLANHINIIDGDRPYVTIIVLMWLNIMWRVDNSFYVLCNDVKMMISMIQAVVSC